MNSQENTYNTSGGNYNQGGHNGGRRDAGIGDLMGSMIGFATAGTRFTFQQMQNAMTMVTDPQCVMNRMRESLDNISNAMNQPTAAGSGQYSNAGNSGNTGNSGRQNNGSSEPQMAEDAINGRKV